MEENWDLPQQSEGVNLRLSYLEWVLLQVTHQRAWEWQLGGTVSVFIDGQASKMLEGGEGLGLVHCLLQLQQHSVLLKIPLGSFGWGFINLTLLHFLSWSHVVLYHAGHIRE